MSSERDVEQPPGEVFDLLVLGTGLQECLLAAAAARSGSKVLQVDEADFYGGESAGVPLSQLPTLATGFQMGEVAVDIEADAVSNADSGPAFPEQWPIRFHGSPAINAPALTGGAARRLTVDLIPALTLSRGVAVDALATSGVSSYLDFVVLQAAYCLQARNAGGWTLRQLPCSKSDVFDDASLSLVEKRTLMKFLQFAVDLVRAREAAAVAAADAPVATDLSSLNERILGMGRSLLRPQNKAAADLSLDGDRGSVPFRSFLSSSAGLPAPLCELMEAAVALAEGGGCVLDAATGMARIAAYVGALGRYGSTACILPRFGHGEVPQAYSRACAVFGGTYMLRTRVVRAAIVDGVHELSTAEGALLRARAVAGTAAYLPRAIYAALPPAPYAVGAAVAVISPPLAAAAGFAEGEPAHSLLRKMDVASNGAPPQRELLTLIIPPGAPGLSNLCAVYVLQQGHGNAMTPAGTATLNVWTQQPVTAGDCAAARVAAVAVAERTLRLLLGVGGDGERDGADAAKDAEQLLHLQLLSYHGRDASGAAAASRLPAAWHVLAGRTAHAMRLTSEFDVAEAQRVFALVCPGRRFLAKEDAAAVASAMMQQQEQEQQQQEQEHSESNNAVQSVSVEESSLEADLACLREDD